MRRAMLRRMGRTALYTIGYEGMSAEQLVSRVKMAGARVVVDVRLNPISRKAGLSKTKLAQRLEDADIAYVHEPLLGNPRDNRDHFKPGGDVRAGRRAFEARLDNGSSDALQRLLDLVESTSVAILCFERSSAHCHRDVIAERVRDADVGVPVVDL